MRRLKAADAVLDAIRGVLFCMRPRVKRMKRV